MSRQNFDSPEHALFVGMTAGQLMRAYAGGFERVTVAPLRDDNNDYLPLIRVTYEPSGRRFLITIDEETTG